MLPDDVETETSPQTDKPTNPIVQAYEQGKRIRHKEWGYDKWIKKYNENTSIDEIEIKWKTDDWIFVISRESQSWEIWHEDAKGNTATQTDAIQQAIDLLKSNGYEVYKIEKIKI